MRAEIRCASTLFQRNPLEGCWGRLGACRRLWRLALGASCRWKPPQPAGRCYLNSTRAHFNAPATTANFEFCNCKIIIHFCLSFFLPLSCLHFDQQCSSLFCLLRKSLLFPFHAATAIDVTFYWSLSKLPSRGRAPCCWYNARLPTTAQIKSTLYLMPHQWNHQQERFVPLLPKKFEANDFIEFDGDESQSIKL